MRQPNIKQSTTKWPLFFARLKLDLGLACAIKNRCPRLNILIQNYNNDKQTVETENFSSVDIFQTTTLYRVIVLRPKVGINCRIRHVKKFCVVKQHDNEMRISPLKR